MKLIVTIGDCNGIGIEVMMKAIARFDRQYPDAQSYEIDICGNTGTIKLYCDYLNYNVKFENNGIKIGNHHCNIIECKNYSHIEFGTISRSAGMLSAEAIESAVEKIQSGYYDAMITMPISKESIQLSGWKYPGHTEMLADKLNVKQPIMILASGNFRVAIATIHIPISKVSATLNMDNLVEIIRIYNRALISDFGIRKPKIAALGLNPHAGENGRIGNEEIEIIYPALEKCKMEKIDVYGPIPADGFFAHGDYRFFDGIIAMYHDQGLIPLKLVAAGSGVNITAGLPIVRTSPDHGTAYQIAGRDIADETSAFEAIKMAIEISKRRNENVIKPVK